MYSIPSRQPHYRAALSASLATLALGDASVAVSACVGELRRSEDGKAPTEIMLAPAGKFRARDGRPGTEMPFDDWFLDAAAAQAIIARANAAQGDYVIDYEHQTLLAEENGLPAPAAGWFKRLEWREGQGLYAVGVRWTAKASAMIEAGEYRYISPVIWSNKKTGTVVAIEMAALTNYPAIDGHSDLAARAAARFSLQHPNQPTPEDSTVDREELIKLLGLAADASDDAIAAALKAATQAQTDLAALRTELELKDDKDDAKAAITALKTKASATAEPDLSQYVPKEVHEETRAQLTALKGQGETAELERLIKEGLDDGRIAGKATADWLRKQGLTALKAHLDDAPSLAALKGTQTQGKKPEGTDADDGELTEAELAVCKNMGIDPKTYKEVN